MAVIIMAQMLYYRTIEQVCACALELVGVVGVVCGGVPVTLALGQ